MKEEDSVDDGSVINPEVQTVQEFAQADAKTSVAESVEKTKHTATTKSKPSSSKKLPSIVLAKFVNRLFLMVMVYLKAIKQEIKQLDTQKLIKGLVTGITLSELFRKFWLFFFVGFILSMGQIGVSYLMRDELLKKGRLERRLRNIAYKSLERSSQLREQTLGSNIEKMLIDSTLQVSNEAPFQLVVDTDDEE